MIRLGGNTSSDACTQVTLAVQADDTQVVVEVLNDGTAIPEEDVQSILEPFSHMNPATETGTSALGLPLAARLATRLGGELRVSSVGGQGSTLTFAFPRSVPKRPS